jgi:hypothetical protein
MACDGANIWIISYNQSDNSNAVTKMRTSDGTLVGTYPLASGETWWGISFDGVKMWITQTGAHSVAIR